MEKTCSKCELTKDISCFKNKSGKYSHLYFSYCIECKKSYDRENTKNKFRNNEEYRARVLKKRNAELKAYKQELKTLVDDYLSGHPCIECGESNIEILDFDHRDRNEKEYLIVSMVALLKSKAMVGAEIAKCDVRCGNCHRHKTMHESNSWRADYCTRENCEWINA